MARISESAPMSRIPFPVSRAGLRLVPNRQQKAADLNNKAALPRFCLKAKCVNSSSQARPLRYNSNVLIPLVVAAST